MKPAIRRLLGPVYPMLHRLKSSGVVHAGKVQLGMLPYRREIRKSRGRLIVDITSPMGMGAVLAYLLRLHAYAEDQGLEAGFVSSSPLYSKGDGEDFLEHYFDRPARSPHAKPLSSQASEWLLHREIEAELSLERSSALFAQYFKPNARLRQAIEAASGGIERFDLSIHFRGTDKFLESGRVDIHRMLDALDAHLPDGGKARQVFLATDDSDFGAAVLARYPDAHFVSFDIGEVAPGIARHFSSLSPDDKAIEALVNLFLLGRAPLCVRTSSYLSSLARIASPGLQTLTINWTGQAALPFPEAQIRQEENDAAGGLSWKS